MAQAVAYLLIERLMAWGVFRIYSYPDAGITGNRGLRKGDQVYDFVQVRHEEASAFIACSHAKYSGEGGVCLVTSSPGDHSSLLR